METNAKLPHYVAIFTSKKSTSEDDYADRAERMVRLTKQQSGFIGSDSAWDDIGITVPYWEGLDAISAWKQNLDT